MEDWALIRRLAAEGVPKAAIARRLGISRTTVIKAVTSDGPPKYERRPAPTSFTPFESRVRELLADTPDMPATVLAERVGGPGRSGGSATTSTGFVPITVRSTRPTGCPGRPVTSRSAICGSRRANLARGRVADVVAGAGDDGRALPVHARPDDPDPQDP